MSASEPTRNYQPATTTVVLLAAGRGERMRPLTDHTPKPLLKVGSQTLIEHHLYRLARLGFRHVIINIAHLSEQFPAKLGDGSRYGLAIHYSDESGTGALETAGGLHHALPLISSDPFLVVNSDIWTDFDFTAILSPLSGLGRLVLVDNPEHNFSGDFVMQRDGYLSLADNASSSKLTFSGIALYRKSMFDSLTNEKQALAPVLRQLIGLRQLQAIKHIGAWLDVGTPERLEQLDSALTHVG